MPNYTVPGTKVPKNKLGAADPETLERLEALFVEARIAELDLGFALQEEAAIPDSRYLKLLHKHLFQDVYEWAGHSRDEPVRLSDRTVATEPSLRKPDGKLFLPGDMIPHALAALDEHLKASDYLRNLPANEFIKKAGDLLVRINNIHPFREGNGRTQRAFLETIGRQAGHELDFEAISGERMVVASIAGHDADTGPMRRVIADALDRDRIRELKEVQHFLTSQKFEWMDLYVATAAPGLSYQGQVAAVNKTNFILREDDNRIIVGRVADVEGPVVGKQRLAFKLPPAEPNVPFAGRASPDEVLARAKAMFGDPSPDLTSRPTAKPRQKKNGGPEIE